MNAHMHAIGALDFCVQGASGEESFMVNLDDMKIEFAALTVRHIMNNCLGDGAKSGQSKKHKNWAAECAKTHNGLVGTHQRVNHTSAEGTKSHHVV